MDSPRLSSTQTLGVWSRGNIICVITSTYFGGGENQIKLQVLRLCENRKKSIVTQLWYLTSENIESDQCPFWLNDCIGISYTTGVRLFEIETGTIRHFIENTAVSDVTIWNHVFPLWSTMNTPLVEWIPTTWHEDGTMEEEYYMLRTPFLDQGEEIAISNGVHFGNPRDDGIMTLMVNNNRAYFDFTGTVFFKDKKWYDSMKCGWEIEQVQNPSYNGSTPVDDFSSSVAPSGGAIAFSVCRRVTIDIIVLTCAIIDIETPTLMWQHTVCFDNDGKWALPVAWYPNMVTFFINHNLTILWSKKNESVVLTHENVFPSDTIVLSCIENRPYLISVHSDDDRLYVLKLASVHQVFLDFVKNTFPPMLGLKVELFTTRWNNVETI